MTTTGAGAVAVALEGTRLGYWVVERKVAKQDFADLLSRCREAKVVLREINNAQMEAASGGRLLDEQGRQEEKFDCMLHHVSDLLASGKEGDRRVLPMLRNFKSYVRRHPETTLVDPLTPCRRLANRYKTCRYIREKLTAGVDVPPFALLKASYGDERRRRLLRDKGLTFPMLAKSISAHQHDMKLIFNENGVLELTKDRLLQTFVPHDGALFKVFVIGRSHWLVHRPSLRNVEADGRRASVDFVTWDVSKPGSNHSQLNLARGELERRTAERRQRQPDGALVDRLVRQLSAATGLTLYGVDLILETKTGRHYLIDINYFPGYAGVERVGQRLFDHLSHYLLRAAAAANKRPTTTGLQGQGQGQGQGHDDEEESTASENTLTDEPKG